MFIGVVGTNCTLCSNCVGGGQAQYLVSYILTAKERARPNIQSEGKKTSEDNQQKKR